MQKKEINSPITPTLLHPLAPTLLQGVQWKVGFILSSEDFQPILGSELGLPSTSVWDGNTTIFPQLTEQTNPQGYDTQLWWVLGSEGSRGEIPENRRCFAIKFLRISCHTAQCLKHLACGGGSSIRLSSALLQHPHLHSLTELFSQSASHSLLPSFCLICILAAL